MKLFTKTLMVAGLLATCTGWSDICNKAIPGDLGLTRTMRAIVLAKDKTWQGDDVLPDPNWTQAISLGVLTQTAADNLVNEAIADFYAKYGIDFTNEKPDGAGTRTLPKAKLSLTIQGIHQDFFLVLDSGATNRGRDWYVIMPAVLIQFSGSGQIPGGTYNSLNYWDGYRYMKGKINLLRNNAYASIPPFSEVFDFVSDQLSPKTITPAGYTQYMYIFKLKDAYDNAGVYSDSSIVHSPTSAALELDPTLLPNLESLPLMLFQCPN